MRKRRRKSAHGRSETAALNAAGVADIKELLRSESLQDNWHRTYDIADSETHPQNVKSHELNWAHLTSGGIEFFRLEVRTDRHGNTGNFFLETENSGRLRAGDGDWLIYYFIANKKAYALPLHALREWFDANSRQFERRTIRSEHDGQASVVEGRLVRIGRVLQEIKEVKIFEQTEKGWECLRSDLAAHGAEIGDFSLSELFL